MHHAKVAAAAVTAAELKELCPLQVEGLEGLLPVLGELVLGQPDQDSIEGPLGSNLRWDGSRVGRVGSTTRLRVSSRVQAIHGGSGICVSSALRRRDWP